MSKKVFRLKYPYYDADGKRHVKTFTAQTEAKARRMAKEWERNREDTPGCSITVLNAVDSYLKIKENVLSPSTIRSCESIKKTHIKTSIGHIPIEKLKKATVQSWISSLVDRGLSAKTIRNCYGLFSAAIKMYDDKKEFNITLPTIKKYEAYCPSDNDIKTLIEHIRSEHDQPLLIALMLSAFGPLRAGEACALTSDDIHGNTVSINKSMVLTKDNTWEIKQPKTISSNRNIVYPDFVIKELAGIKGNIVGMNPNQLYMRFRRALSKTNLEYFRFHDLRHYGCSIMHAIGVPDIYILRRGGWGSDYCMKKVYRNAISDEEKKQTENILKHFATLV